MTQTKSKKKQELLLNQIVDILTNIPASCFSEFLKPIEEVYNPAQLKYEFENMNLKAIYILVQFLENRLDQVRINLSPITSLVSCYLFIYFYFSQTSHYMSHLHQF